MCAALYDSRTQGSVDARAFWRDEYRLNALIGRYPKPLRRHPGRHRHGRRHRPVRHTRYRIVTERSQLAMPETGIGLIPDVGGTWLLAHAPGDTGIYLGSDRREHGAADAIYARFSDVFIPASKLGALRTRLIDAEEAASAEAISAPRSRSRSIGACSAGAATSTGFRGSDAGSHS